MSRTTLFATIITTAVLSAAATGATVYLVMRPGSLPSPLGVPFMASESEATVQGRTLSSWMARAKDLDGDTSREALMALRKFVGDEERAAIYTAFHNAYGFEEMGTAYNAAADDAQRRYMEGRIEKEIRAEELLLRGEEAAALAKLRPAPKGLLPVLRECSAYQRKEFPPMVPKELEEAIKTIEADR